MYHPKQKELLDSAVKITWCMCARCLAVGPRTMTLNRNGHEYTVSLHTECCDISAHSPQHDRD
jgi:hypothetical protein